MELFFGKAARPQRFGSSLDQSSVSVALPHRKNPLPFFKFLHKLATERPTHNRQVENLGGPVQILLGPPFFIDFNEL